MNRLTSLMKNTDLTKGSVTGSIWLFALPLMIGNLLQQFYNIADTLIVGRFLGPNALAAVGSSYTVMTLLTSIILGLCMGSGVLFSMLYGAGDREGMKLSFVQAFAFTGLITLLVEILAVSLRHPMMRLLNIPEDIYVETGKYLSVVFLGLVFTFIYNFFAVVLRSVGNSVVPLMFLGFSAILNIVLDYVFIMHFHSGVEGAAFATILSQLISAIALLVYVIRKLPWLIPEKRHFYLDMEIMRKISSYSVLTCIQQSVMNFGILMIQGLVNSYGVAVMAAFAAAVKIDSFAYMPVQDFGNAFSTFIAQNKGAGEQERIRKGLRSAIFSSAVFCLVISAAVFTFAKPLMTVFIDAAETEIIMTGVGYLRIEGACYIGIGCLFLLYGLYRGLGRAELSIVLTVISLGTRVLLSYTLSGSLGLNIIWWSIPIGWFLADAVGLLYFRKIKL